MGPFGAHPCAHSSPARCAGRAKSRAKTTNATDHGKHRHANNQATGAKRRRSRTMRACSSGPLGGGEGWAEKPAGKPAWRPACFSSVHGGTVEKPRPPFTDLAGMDARQAPPRGALLFGYFLLGTQEKVTRPDRAESAAGNRHASREAWVWRRWGSHPNLRTPSRGQPLAPGKKAKTS